MDKIILLILSLSLFSCQPPPVWETDQDIRRELFKECMESLPAGPNEVVYNDWAEVVSECRGYAQYASKRRVK